MRPLELSSLLVALLALLNLGRSQDRVNRLGQVLAVMAAILTIAQLGVEGYRWQMIPAYAGVSTLLLFHIVHRHRQVRWTRLTAGAVLVLLLAAVAMATVYPVFQLPQPTGPYRIGTQVYHLVDPDRMETLASISGGHRELMIQVWYPAEPGARGKAAPYREPAAVTFRDAYLTLVRTHALVRAPMARTEATYPVLLFSPSWHGVRNQNMFQVEELVSHGFIVVGVDHPYSSGVVVFPDGRVVRARPDKFLDTSTDQTLKDSLRLAENQVHIRAADLIFVLNSLQKLNTADQSGILTGRLDLNRVGVFGYSFGGAVAMQACWMDRRFKAALNLDGMVFGQAANDGIEQPLMVITDRIGSEPMKTVGSPTPRERWEEIVNIKDLMIGKDLRKLGDYTLQIPQAGHGNFSDSALFSPLRWLTDSGQIDRRTAMRIVNDYSLAFFQKSLNHSPQTLLDGSTTPYVEATLTANSNR